jgi:hypothetical protein
MTSNEALLLFFETGDYPTSSQFGEFIISKVGILSETGSLPVAANTNLGQKYLIGTTLYTCILTGEDAYSWEPTSWGGGVTVYGDLTGKPTINSVVLSGNKTDSDLSLVSSNLSGYALAGNLQSTDILLLKRGTSLLKTTYATLLQSQSTSIWNVESSENIYVNANTIQITGEDMTGIYKKGTVITWNDDSGLKRGMVYDSAFSTSTTINIVGDVVTSNYYNNSLKYCIINADIERIFVPGTIATESRLGVVRARADEYLFGVNLFFKTAAATDSSFTFVNGGSDYFSVVSPIEIVGEAISMPNVMSVDESVLLTENEELTVNKESGTSTQEDMYVDFYTFPAKYFNLS